MNMVAGGAERAYGQEYYEGKVRESYLRRFVNPLLRTTDSAALNGRQLDRCNSFKVAASI